MASTSLIADMTTVFTNGPNAATLAKAISPTGPIMDYPANVDAVRHKLRECSALLANVILDTDAGDGQLTNLSAVQAALGGTTSPSAGVLTSMGTVTTTGPTANTLVKAIAPAGKIMDYVGNTNLVTLMLKESKQLISKVITDTDATDATNLGLLNGVLATLS